MNQSTTELIFNFTGAPSQLKPLADRVRADLARVAQVDIGAVRKTMLQAAAESQTAANLMAEWRQHSAAEASRIVGEIGVHVAAQEWKGKVRE